MINSVGEREHCTILNKVFGKDFAEKLLFEQRHTYLKGFEKQTVRLTGCSLFRRGKGPEAGSCPGSLRNAKELL